MISADHLWILALALVADAMAGDPDWLWRRLPHPVVLIGTLIDRLDRTCNRNTYDADRRRTLGVVVILVVVLISGGIGWFLESLFVALPYGWIATALVAAIMLAGRSLYDHVAAVAFTLEASGLDAARREIAKIVGRDPKTLDESGVSRAAIESTAESLSDGLVAPAFWFAILGLPGLFAYKAINTADSMIGHRSDRYRDFGWASARLDDLVNWLPARLSALLIALAAPLAGGSAASALAVVGADASKHPSPNAGRPEAAMAGAIGVALLGPRTYEGAVANDLYINQTARPAIATDVRSALRVYIGAWALGCLVVLVFALAFCL